MSKILELADAYAEAKAAVVVSVQTLGRYSKLSQHYADTVSKASAALQAEVEKQDALLRQALEALEKVHIVGGQRAADDAIKAIKEHLK